MPALKTLLIGGTGVISSACAERAVAHGLDVTLLNRGSTSIRPVPDGVEVIHADVRDAGAIRSALGARDFDVVADFVAFTPEHVQADLDLFRGRTGQYVFISSTVVYQMPPRRLPIVESSLQRNPHWGYAGDKIACEDVLARAFRDEDFPVTIVRPSHTYDRTLVPILIGGWTVIDRMRRGRPVVVHGDGTSAWVLTHSRDFATAFVGLLGNPQAIGESFHITSDEVLTWNQIYQLLATAAGVEAKLVHLSSETIARIDPALGAALLGHSAHSVIYDNGKVKAQVPEYVATVPFSLGAREIIDWHHTHPEHQVVNDAGNVLLDKLVELATAEVTPPH